ncbi:hypothetical protein UA45_18525 [Morganella morganii]|uniref:Uncharacterized protein n=1 Tax=Morganella morganii TaxID=582 RepID=A0A0D8L3G9_MORMO|nr:hypothetical protein UA45_18525 [Morganella morganii]
MTHVIQRFIQQITVLMRFNSADQLRLFAGIKIGSYVIIKTDDLIGNSADYRYNIRFIQRDPAEFIFFIPPIIN